MAESNLSFPIPRPMWRAAIALGVVVGLLGVAPVTADDRAGAEELPVVAVDVPVGADLVAFPAGGGVTSIRSFVDGIWGPWQSLHGADEAPDHADDEVGVGPVWVGGATAIEVRAAGEVTTWFDDVDAPVAALDAPVPGTAAALVGANGAPAINSRATWGAASWAYANDDCDEGPIINDRTQAIVVHHTVTSNSYTASQVPGILRSLQRFHQDTQGWCDLGYNLVIDRFGGIWEGRAGGVDLPVQGGHARGFNTGTTGVAMLGQHQAGASPTGQAPTAAARASLEAVAAWKLGTAGADPGGTVWLRYGSDSPGRYASGTWVEVDRLTTHHALGQTSCPGSYVRAETPGMRNVIGAAWQPSTGSFPTWNPELIGIAGLSVRRNGTVLPAGAADDVGAGASAGTFVAIDSTDSTRGYRVRSDGSLVAFGGAPTVSGPAMGGRSAIDVLVAASGNGGWVLDDNGDLRPFGSAGAVAITWNGPARAIIPRADRSSGWVLDIAGLLHPFGGAPFLSATGGIDAVAGVATSDSSGWVLDSAGRLHGFGGTGDTSATLSGTPIGVVASGDGIGGWVVESTGRWAGFGGQHPVLAQATVDRAADVVDVAARWVGPNATWLASNDARRQQRLASLFRGENPDPVTLAALSRSYTFAMDRDAVVRASVTSGHWAGERIDELYLEVLGRGPDADGRAFWVDRMVTTRRFDRIAGFFYASPEYFADAGGTNTAFVESIYRSILGRPADPTGLAHWVGELNAGTTRGAIVLGFHRSAEYRAARVDSVFRAVLERAPDADELEEWLDPIHTDGEIEMAVSLARTSEFAELGP